MLKKIGFIVLCAMPSITLLLLTLTESGSNKAERETFMQLIRILAGFHFMWSYDTLEIILGRLLILFVFIIFSIVLWHKIVKSRLEQKDSLIFSLLCCTILYFIAPESMAGGGSINIRISAYIYFLIVTWLGYQNHQKIVENLSKYLSIFIFLVLVIFNSVKSIQISDLIEEYVSISPYVREKSTIVSFDFLDRGLNYKDHIITNRRGIGHATGYIAASRNSINLGNYQATRDNFPLKFRPETYPRTYLISQPPKITDYNLKTQGKIDYILLWGTSQAKNNNNLKHIKKQLDDSYQLVNISKKRGLVELYKINQ